MSTDGPEPTILDGIESVRAALGSELGTSPWVEVGQERIDAFADCTGDNQWIHVDPQRAATESPYGTTIAHGYLTLSLINHLLPQVVEVRGFAMGINYGLDRVRFPAPVPASGHVRAHVELTEVIDLDDGVQTLMTVTVECRGQDRPACVASVLSRFVSPTD